MLHFNFAEILFATIIKAACAVPQDTYFKVFPSLYFLTAFEVLAVLFTAKFNYKCC